MIKLANTLTINTLLLDWFIKLVDTNNFRKIIKLRRKKEEQEEQEEKRKKIEIISKLGF